MYDSLAFLTKKLVIEGVFLQTYEFKCPKSNNKGPVSYFVFVLLIKDCLYKKFNL